MLCTEDARVHGGVEVVLCVCVCMCVCVCVCVRVREGGGYFGIPRRILTHVDVQPNDDDVRFWAVVL